MTCHSIFFKDNRDSAFYELLLLKDFCCLNTAFINRFPHAILQSTVDFISVLFSSPDTMVFVIVIKIHRPNADCFLLDIVSKYFEMLAFLKDEVVP